jgi:hypothetical protein
MTGKIIKFPSRVKQEDQLNEKLEELQRTIELFKKAKIELMVDDITTYIIEYMYNNKMQVTREDIFFDFCLASESVRSLLYSYVGYNHPLQNYASTRYFHLKNKDNDKQLELFDDE